MEKQKRRAKNINNQLGMSSGKARNILVKSLLFQLICETGRNHCYRCGEPMTVDDYTIEHIEAWLHHPEAIRLYFSVKNISFSHSLCNSAFSRKRKGYVPYNKGKITHGTSGYRSGCRCELCKEIYSQARKEKYARLQT